MKTISRNQIYIFCAFIILCLNFNSCSFINFYGVHTGDNMKQIAFSAPSYSIEKDSNGKFAIVDLRTDKIVAPDIIGYAYDQINDSILYAIDQNNTYIKVDYYQFEIIKSNNLEEFDDDNDIIMFNKISEKLKK